MVYLAPRFLLSLYFFRIFLSIDVADMMLLEIVYLFLLMYLFIYVFVYLVLLIYVNTTPEFTVQYKYC